MKDFPTLYSGDISFIAELEGRLCLPLRHTKYQIENFILKKESLPKELQYKQCVRELRVRVNIVRERQLEYEEVLLKADALFLDKEELEGDLSKEVQGSIVARRLIIRIKQIENAIAMISFRAEVIREDVADHIREIRIFKDCLDDLEKSVNLESLDLAESRYFSLLDTSD